MTNIHIRVLLLLTLFLLGPSLSAGDPKRPAQPTTKSEKTDVIQAFDFSKIEPVKGKRILIWCQDKKLIKENFHAANPMWKALGSQGYIARLEVGPFPGQLLMQADQLWIISSSEKQKEADVDAIEQFARSGKGLLLLADDEPTCREADAMAERLFGTRIKGNHLGRKVAVVEGTKGKLAEDTYKIKTNAFLNKINFIYEGSTISHVEASDKLETVLSASDGEILVAVSKVRQLRVVIDCGFTRYTFNSKNPKETKELISKTQGNLPLLLRIAAFLGS